MIPRKNRLRIYVDGQDKFYRLREFKRNLAAVVVKVLLITHNWLTKPSDPKPRS